MTISTLKTIDFRNLTQAMLIPCQHGINIITGNNGSGKTSLLEAIYYLGMGRSFRASNNTSLINHQRDKFSIFFQLVNANGRVISVGIERGEKLARNRLDEQEIQGFAELASLLPVRLINSQSHHFFESGPSYRRKFIDWGLFYTNDEFLNVWRGYERALKQRNMMLRERKSHNELRAWTHEVARYGMMLNQLRSNYLNDLVPIVHEVASDLLSVSTELIVQYYPGWNGQADLQSKLEELYHEEMLQGYTLAGPHRADLEIALKGIEVKHILSRGQQKLLICAMILAQGKLLKNVRKNKPLVYLIDDLPAELDKVSCYKLMHLLKQQNSQIFITAIENEAIFYELIEEKEVPIKLFHVEHGVVKEDMAG